MLTTGLRRSSSSKTETGAGDFCQAPTGRPRSYHCTLIFNYLANTVPSSWVPNICASYNAVGIETIVPIQVYSNSESPKDFYAFDGTKSEILHPIISKDFLNVVVHHHRPTGNVTVALVAVGENDEAGKLHIRLEKFGDSQKDLDIDLLDAQNGVYGRLCDQSPLCLDRNEFNLASTYCVSKVNPHCTFCNYDVDFVWQSGTNDGILFRTGGSGPSLDVVIDTNEQTAQGVSGFGWLNPNNNFEFADFKYLLRIFTCDLDF